MGNSPTDQLFFEADALWDKGRSKEAFRLFLEAAKAGDLGAQVNVGGFYARGEGVEKSRAQALYWYRRAARRGEAAAATNIGVLYREEGRLRLALRWFAKAVALGDDDTLLDMARLHAGPLGDIEEARRLLSSVLSSKNITVDTREQAQRLKKQLRAPSR